MVIHTGIAGFLNILIKCVPLPFSLHDLEVEDKLKSWMNNTPAYLQLQWFDAVEEVKISSELRSKRWNTEVTKRDRLYLTKMGMNLT